MKKMKWGILGTGRIAGVFCDMLSQLAQQGEVELYAVGSRSVENAQEFGARYGFTKSYGSYQELAADSEIDIIYVATPVGCHYENVRLCLEAGRHVLCEKTLTMSSQEAQELQELARQKGLFLMEAMWMKCMPTFLQVQKWVKEGKLGQLQGIEGRFYTMGGSSHRLYKNRSQGGVLYDLVLYPLTYACSLLGYEPRELQARAVIGGDDIDIMENIQLTYQDGAFATITGGLAPKRQQSLYIQGTKGRILIDGEPFHCAQKVELIDWENQVVETFEEPFAYNGYEYEAREAMECVRQGRTGSSLVPMEETIAVIRLMEQCRSQWT